jgi:hypothetical protein
MMPHPRHRLHERRMVRSAAILVSSIASLLSHGQSKAMEVTTKATKKNRPEPSPLSGLRKADEPGVLCPTLRIRPVYPWKTNIVTTTFWVGERPTKANPVPNCTSSWDVRWSKSFGGTDSPDPQDRRDFHPSGFLPRQNPFYIALPYNDLCRGGYKPEAARVIPWFNQEHEPGKSVCKSRWVAIRYKNRVCYAQWEDAGPFRTDHWEYVFGNDRPKPNMNGGAGLDVSPAVRDFLGMNDTDVTDWKFVEFTDVPQGPWAKLGDNNTFVINQRAAEGRVVMLKHRTAPAEKDES